jgi:hypothetical protein
VRCNQLLYERCQRETTALPARKWKHERWTKSLDLLVCLLFSDSSVCVECNGIEDDRVYVDGLLLRLSFCTRLVQLG